MVYFCNILRCETKRGKEVVKLMTHAGRGYLINKKYISHVIETKLKNRFETLMALIGSGFLIAKLWKKYLPSGCGFDDYRLS